MKTPILKALDLLTVGLCFAGLRVCDQALAYVLDQLIAQPLPRITYFFAKHCPWHCLTLVPWIVALFYLAIRQKDNDSAYSVVMRSAIACSAVLSVGILAGALIGLIPINTGLNTK